MTGRLDWNSVIDRHGVRPEFGACHVNYAWRRHRQDGHKFNSLRNAFISSGNSVIRLLQNLNGNINAANYSSRGNCLYVGLWYIDSPWAILCNPTVATLVERTSLENIRVTKTRDDSIVETIKELFDRSHFTLKRELNQSFYSNNIK